MLSPQTIIEHLNSALLVFDKQLSLLSINTAGEILFDDSARHLIGKPVEYLFFKQSNLIDDLKQAISQGDSFVDRELTLRLPNKNSTLICSVIPITENNELSYL